MNYNFTQILFLLASFIAAIGLIVVVYIRSKKTITSRIFIITLFLVIAYLISHTIHFIFMQSGNLTTLDISCHSLLLMILVSLTFFTWNYPVHKKLGVVRGFFILAPSLVLLILLWSGELINESHSHTSNFTVSFSPIYPIFLLWYLFLVIFNTVLITKKLKAIQNSINRSQIIVYLFGLIITNIATFVFGLFLPWILGFYYLVEISPLAFLFGFIAFTSFSIAKYDMFPNTMKRVLNFSLNKKIIFSAIIVVPIIILVVQIPLGRIIFNINSSPEMIRFFIMNIFIGLLVSISMSFIISRLIAHPISILTNKVLQVEKGDFSVRTEIDSNDEVGELSNAFNKLAFTLNSNISELKIKEERIVVLLNAFEKSLAAIAIVDDKFYIIEANDQFYEMIDEDQTTNVKASIEFLQFRYSLPLFKSIIEEVNLNSVYTNEIEIKSIDNQTNKFVLLSVSKIFNPESIPKGYLFIEIDITERKKLESEIIRSEKLASLGKMSATIAHEIKTPLTSIKMNVDMISKSITLEPEDRESFQIISKEVNRLNKLVKEVLQITRTAPLSLEIINIRFFIEEIISQISFNLKNKIISFYNKSEDFDLFFDKDKLKQVFLNLFQNSIEAIHDNGFITINSSKDEEFIYIKIIDNGTGINDPKTIFDPFYTDKASGTGLGLSISKRIIEQHNGELELISSKPGETIFQIKLPI
ncbi:MAG: ATP-binding protein [Melioribacteraceae bacterium]